MCCLWVVPSVLRDLPSHSETLTICPASDDKHIIFGDSGSLLSEPEPYAFTSLTMKDFVFDYLRLLPQFPCVKRESDSVCVCVGVGVCQPVVCGVCDEI